MLDLRALPSLSLQLDSTAQAALNLFPSQETSDKYGALLGVLSKGQTPMAPRLLKEWLLSPLVDMPQLQRRHNYVALLLADTDLFHALHGELLRKFPNLDAIIRRIKRPDAKIDVQASIKLLFQVFEAFRRVAPLVTALENHSGEHAAMLHAECSQQLREHILPDASKFQDMIEATFDVEARSATHLLVYLLSVSKMRARKGICATSSG